ncbi:MAG: glycerophosphodiester phosphodiesterase [Planctomycetales bacterium]|nr:glycerophosphodiester phosphodiesterase [Planctomycetales bacterium]
MTIFGFTFWRLAGFVSLRRAAQTACLSLILPASCGFGQMIVAHRGASYDAPENTLAAFAEAWRQQADGIEGDFHLTKDQQIVCIHDKDTQRTAGQQLVVADSTLAQLRELEYGKWKAAKFAGEPIPTFQQVYECVPDGKLFVVELKTGPEIVPLLKEKLAEIHHGRIQLLIIAFDAETAAACKQTLPELKVHWLTGHRRNKLTGQWSPSLQDAAEQLKKSTADGLGTQGERQVVNADWVSQMSKAGMQEFHVWTVDEPTDALYFQRLGAIGITTNRPTLIRQALAKE